MILSSESNAAMEIHDSTLERIQSDGDALVAVITAYVHRSSGTPGVDQGTGWVQTAHLRFSRARARGTLDGVPMELLDGHLQLPGAVVHNLIPMPFHFVGRVRIQLSGWEPNLVTIDGHALDATLVGTARYFGEFKPSAPAGGDIKTG